MSKLIFCEDCKVYKKIDKSLLWNYFITDSITDCKKYISLYSPRFIIISNKMLHVLSDILTYINTAYSDYPSILIYAQAQIFSLITDDAEKRHILKADLIPVEIDKIIDNMLINYKFQPRLKGYTYIKRALYEGLINESAFINIKKFLYSNIATMYLVSEASVERGMRFTIEKAYRDSTLLHDVFNNSDSPPSNLSFLKRFYIELKSVLPSNG